MALQLLCHRAADGTLPGAVRPGAVLTGAMLPWCSSCRPICDLAGRASTIEVLGAQSEPGYTDFKDKKIVPYFMAETYKSSEVEANVQQACDKLGVKRLVRKGNAIGPAGVHGQGRADVALEGCGSSAGGRVRRLRLQRSAGAQQTAWIPALHALACDHVLGRNPARTHLGSNLVRDPLAPADTYSAPVAYGM